jgi:hypothetical protein
MCWRKKIYCMGKGKLFGSKTASELYNEISAWKIKK